MSFALAGFTSKLSRRMLIVCCLARQTTVGQHILLGPDGPSCCPGFVLAAFPEEVLVSVKISDLLHGSRAVHDREHSARREMSSVAGGWRVRHTSARSATS